MKTLLTTILLTVYVLSFGQSVQQRTDGTSTVSDGRVKIPFNLIVPVYADTTAAGLEIGLDSCGAIIFVYADSGKLYVRKCFPTKYWAVIGGGSGGGSSSTLTSVGSGFRIGVNATNNVKTVFGSTWLGIDSTTNANAITISNLGLFGKAGNDVLGTGVRRFNAGNFKHTIEGLPNGIGDTSIVWRGSGGESMSFMASSPNRNFSDMRNDKGHLTVDVQNLSEVGIIVKQIDWGVTSGIVAANFYDSLKYATAIGGAAPGYGASAGGMFNVYKNDSWNLVGQWMVSPKGGVYGDSTQAFFWNGESTVHAGYGPLQSYVWYGGYFANEYMRLARTTGYMGLNNSSPTERLDITGNLRLSGAFMPNNLPGTSTNVLTSGGAGSPPVWVAQSSIVGAVPTLQAVTDVGATTTNTVTSNALKITGNSLVSTATSTGIFEFVTPGTLRIKSFAANNAAAGAIRFENLSSDGSSFVYVPLTLFSNGNVGIGNSAPGELLTLGNAGTTKGLLSMSGNTSGKIVIQPAAAAGSYTLTLPTTDGNANEFLKTDGNGVTTWAAAGTGTVTSVGFTGGLISVANPTTTPDFTVAGTSGGIPYFSSTSTWASSSLLAANALMIGGGAGVAPATTTTGTGVLTALGVNVGSAGAFVVNGGALGTPSSGTLTSATGYLWNNLANPTGDLALTFDAGESTTFTNSNTTEDLLTMSSSTMTTSSMISINSTSTALASGNNLAELIMSGANATNAITATALRISVTNTNATSGTNVGMTIDVSGATTGNVGAIITGPTGSSSSYSARFIGRVAMGGVTTPFADLDVGGGSINAGSLTITSAAGSPVNGNMFTGSTTLLTGTSGSTYQVLSSTTIDGRIFFGGTGATAVGVGRPYGTVIIGGATVPEAASGTHSLIASMIIVPPAITGAAATVTKTATLYIDAAPSATVTDNNYAVFIRSGISNFGGSIQIPYQSTATSLTADATQNVISISATGQTITLPTAVGIQGRVYTIKLTASGSATVATTSSQTIDGSTTYSLSAQYKFVTVISNNANWEIIANN